MTWTRKLFLNPSQTFFIYLNFELIDPNLIKLWKRKWKKKSRREEEKSKGKKGSTLTIYFHQTILISIYQSNHLQYGGDSGGCCHLSEYINMWKRKWKTCNFRLFTCILKIKKSFGHIDFASKTKKRAGELIKRGKLHGRFLQTVLVSPLVWAWEICSLLQIQL